MTKTQLATLVDRTLADARSLLLSKNDDYAGEADVLSNFRAYAERLDLPPLKVWAVLFEKHVSAIWSYVRTGKLETEPIEHRILDALNYLLLLRAFIEEGRPRPTPWPQAANEPPSFLRVVSDAAR